MAVQGRAPERVVGLSMGEWILFTVAVLWFALSLALRFRFELPALWNAAPKTEDSADSHPFMTTERK